MNMIRQYNSHLDITKTGWHLAEREGKAVLLAHTLSIILRISGNELNPMKFECQELSGKDSE